jgi:hypothetical protein
MRNSIHLPEHLRKRDFEFEFKRAATIQAIIESWAFLEEVDLILAEGQSIGLYVAAGRESASILFSKA